MIRKAAITFLLFLSLLCALPPAGGVKAQEWGATIGFVTDQADILSAQEEQRLSERAAKLSEQHDCIIYLVTLDDYRKYYDGSIEDCAEALREEHKMDWSGDMILLLLSMEDRAFDLMAHGDFANASFTDYGKERMQEAFLEDFAEDEWYDGFETYLDQCDRLLSYAEDGTPLDVDSRPVSKGLALLISILLGLVISAIVSLVLCSGMRTAVEKTEANAYIPRGGCDITTRSDQFTHVTETRVYDPPQKRSGSGGGTSVHSSGSSHSSGHF